MNFRSVKKKKKKKAGNVFGLMGHYGLLKWKFLPWCCVVILKESGSEGVD